MIEFVVPGRPVPMARPRVVRGHAYKPKRSADYQCVVAAAAREAMNDKKALEGAVVCRVELYFEIPKSYSCGKHLAARHNMIKPVGRNSGDVDNHAKAVLDALKGICWGDDSQVTKLIVTKRYTETTARAHVWIFEDDGEAASDAGQDETDGGAVRLRKETDARGGL